MDDALKKETESLVRGAPIESRVREEREHEAPGDGDYDTDAFTSDGLGATPVEARRELSRHLRPSAFPADREALLAEAVGQNAPEAVVSALGRLPGGTTFRTVHEVWTTLTHAGDPREDPLAHADR